MQAGSVCGEPGGGCCSVPLACALRVSSSLSGCIAVKYVPLEAKSTWRPSVATSLYLSARMLVPCVSVKCAGLRSGLCVKLCFVAGLGGRFAPRAFFVLSYFLHEK